MVGQGKCLLSGTFMLIAWLQRSPAIVAAHAYPRGRGFAVDVLRAVRT